MAEFSVTQKKGKDGVLLKVSGSLTIQYAGEMREALLAAFAKGDAVTVDIHALKNVDVNGLQLLCAAHRTSIGQNKRLTVIGTTKGLVAEVAQLAGFFRHTGCAQDVTHTCIWIEGA